MSFTFSSSDPLKKTRVCTSSELQVCYAGSLIPCYIAPDLWLQLQAHWRAPGTAWAKAKYTQDNTLCIYLQAKGSVGVYDSTSDEIKNMLKNSTFLLTFCTAFFPPSQERDGFVFLFKGSLNWWK